MNVTSRRPARSTLALLLLAVWTVVPTLAVSARAEEPEAGALPESPTLDACQHYATGHYQQVSPESFVAVELLADDVLERAYVDKAASLTGGKVLTGRAIWKDRASVSDAVFTCLLGGDGKPVFVDVAPTGQRDPVTVCWDGFEPAGWGPLTDCLQAALKREEALLAETLVAATQAAGDSMDKLSARTTLSESNAQWSKYRDAECARRQALVAGRNHPDLDELTCKIRKTDDRIEDFHFDD